MPKPTDHSSRYINTLVKQEDRDRYLTAMFAQPGKRAALMGLYAFNVEVARISDTTTESLIGKMKLEWWRDILSGIYDNKEIPQGNPVVDMLHNIVVSHRLTRTYFDELLNHREGDMIEEAPSNMLSLEAYAEGTSGRLMWLALEILEVRDPASLKVARHIGIAWALTGIIRAVLFYARNNRNVLPQDLMRERQLTGLDAFRRKNTDKISEVITEISVVARHHLDKAKSCHADVDRKALPAFLLAVLADQYLQGLAKRGYDIFDPLHAFQRPSVLKLTWSALRGRY